jgi:hypothetical protein
MTKTIAFSVALLALSLGGCSTYYSQRHPTVESRTLTAAEDAYWVDRRWRQDKAEEWRVNIERSSAARMAREFN